MSYRDVNLIKTKLGYQFDHNVYIGSQINDNRVVTVKEIKGLVSSGGGSGSGGGGGGIRSVQLTASGWNLNLIVDGTTTTVTLPQVTIGNNNVLLSITPSGGAATTLTLGNHLTVTDNQLSLTGIANPTASSGAADTDIATIGYIKNSGLGSNVYSTAHSPTGSPTSSKDTRFIFVEV